jgi:hypothetical protein
MRVKDKRFGETASGGHAMKKWMAALVSSALLGLAGCGGGSENATPAEPGGPVFSTLSFPVRAAYDQMMRPDRPIGLNLAGTDNAKIESTVKEVNWPSWSKMPPPPPELVPPDLRWIGTLTAQKQPLTTAVATPFGPSTVRVDYFLSLKRLRDGREYRDALSVYFDDSYRPMAAVTLESRLWNWLSPLDGLPVSGTIGASSGTAVARACKLPVGLTTSLVCDPDFFEEGDRVSVPAVWTLQPDTALTGFITFAYRGPFLDAIDGTDSFARSEAIVEIKTRIDSTGALQGVEYVRIEGPLTIRLRG